MSDISKFDDGPLVSVLMVARNAGDFIDGALLSARAQTFHDIEIIVVDDGSTDDTRKIAARHAACDRRVRIIAGPRKGLAAVRNLSLAEARGARAVILDSDDLLHPRHVELLYREAEDTGAQIVASNMIAFLRGRKPTARLFAVGKEWRHGRDITRAEFVLAGRLNSGEVSLGYLKPMFDLAFLRSNGIEYDPALRIGEDYDLVSRMMAAGAIYRFCPRPTYFYRRHAESTSYRVSRPDLTSLIAASRSDEGGGDPDLREAAATRRRSLDVALAHLDAVEALKKARPHTAFRHLARHPASLVLLGRSVIEGLSRRLHLAAESTLSRADPDRRPAALLIGEPGQGTAIARAAEILSGAGYTIHMRRADSWDDALRLGSGLPEIDVLLLAHDFACEAAPFALSPEAVWIAKAGTRHPLIDLHVSSEKQDGALDITGIDGPEFIARLTAARQARVERLAERVR